MKRLLLLTISLLPIFSFSGEHKFFFGTSERQLLPHELTEVEFDSSFESHLNKGFFDQWVITKIVLSESSDERVLSLSNSLINRGIFNVFTGDSFRSIQFGLDTIGSGLYSTLPISIVIGPDENLVYIQQFSNTFFWQNVEIRDKIAFMDQRTLSFIFLGSVFTALLLLIIYNLALFFKIRETGHLYYSVYFIGLALMSLYMTGYGDAYIWRKLFLLKDSFEGIFIGLMSLFFLLFTRKVLYVNKTDKTRYFLFSVLSIFSILLILLAILGIHPRFISILSNSLPIALILLVVYTAIKAIAMKQKLARLFLLGWFLFLVGSVVRMLVNWGVIPPGFLSLNLPFLGIIAEAILFFIVVARYFEDEVERKRSEVALYLEQIEDLSSNLELLQSSKEKIPKKEEITNTINNHLIVPLSEREFEVLLELTKNKTYEEMAESLFVSKNTIKTHISRIYSKLSVSSRDEAIKKALELSQ